MQQDFYTGRYTVIGPPGTGKTTFLGSQIRKVVERYSGAFGSSRWPNPVLVCSLTRAAASEVAGRDLPINRKCIGTLHAHCFRALNCPKMIDGSYVKVWNSTTSYQLGASGFGDDSRGSDKDDFAFERRAEANVVTEADALLQKLEILRHRMVPRDTWDRDVCMFADEWDQFKEQNSILDFTDLIERALNSVQIPPGNPAVIMVDEAQDLSKLEYSLIKSWSRASSATIIVGDPWQALYTWRGADPSLFSDPSIPSTHKRVLSQSYRVPSNVLKIAVGWVRDELSTYEPIEYAPRKPKSDQDDVLGEIGIRESTIYDNDQVIEEIEEYLANNKTVMLQVSCSYMLNSLIANLKRKCIPYSNPWRKYRKDWNPLAKTGTGTSMIKRLMSFCSNCEGMPRKRAWSKKDVALFVNPMAASGILKRGAKRRIGCEAEERADGQADERADGQADGQADERADGQADFASETEDPLYFDVATDTEESTNDFVLEEELDDWFEEETAKFIYRVWRGEVSIKEAAEWWRDHLLATPSRVIDYPVSIISKWGIDAVIQPSRVYIGTIHSFKGAEADVTYIFPDLSSSGYKQWNRGRGEQRDEVVRLYYVALTRARERAYICRNASKECCPIRRYVEKFNE